MFSGLVLNCSSIDFYSISWVCTPSDLVHEVESVDNYLMYYYIVYPSVRLSVGGPIIWVHFRSRATSTPWNDEMEGGHIPSFHHREVAPCKWMQGRNYAKNLRVPLRTSSPVVLE